MNWLKGLKMTSVKKSIFGLVLFVGIAVAILVFTKCWGVFGMVAPKALADLTPETMDGAFVKDDISFIYGSYLEIESYKNGRKTGTTGMQYLIDMDETYYMGLYVRSGRLDDAEELADFWADALRSDKEPDLDALPVLHVQGTVRAMDDDDLDYYRRSTRGLDDEALFLPYYLEVDYVHNMPIWGCFLLLAVVAVLLWLGIFPMVKALTGGFQKQVRSKLAEGGSFEREVERAELFYESTPAVSGVRMNREYVFFQNGAESILLRPWDIAWAYQSTTQHRTNGIPTGKTFAAILRTVDGKEYNLSMSEAEVKALLEAIATTLPGTVVGYDKSLEKLYKENRDAFRQRWTEYVSDGRVIETAPRPQPAEPAAPAEEPRWVYKGASASQSPEEPEEH